MSLEYFSLTAIARAHCKSSTAGWPAGRPRAQPEGVQSPEGAPADCGGAPHAGNHCLSGCRAAAQASQQPAAGEDTGTLPALQCHQVKTTTLFFCQPSYEGYLKTSKTNSKEWFIYEIYKIIFLHSIHPIQAIFPSKNSRMEFFDGNIAYRSVMNWMESM